MSGNIFISFKIYNLYLTLISKYAAPNFNCKKSKLSTKILKLKLGNLILLENIEIRSQY